MECPHCGSSSVGSEGSDVNCVCRDCGAVLEEGILSSEVNEAGGSQNISHDVNFTPNGTESTTLPAGYMKSVRSATSTTKVSKGKKQGLKVIKQLFMHLGVTGKPFTQEAIDLYMEATAGQYYRFQNLQKKEILAAICVMVVCRNHDLPITCTFICKTVGINEALFKVAYFKFRKQNNMPVKLLNVIDMVDTICSEESEACRKITKQILSVVQKSWIIEGRFQEAVVMAANFYAWQMMDVQKRHKVTLNGYAQQKGWKLNRVVSQRCKEMGEMFCSLAKELPWLAHQDIGLKQVTYYLKDIISYHKSLISEITSEFAKQQSTDVGNCRTGSLALTEPTPTVNRNAVDAKPGVTDRKDIAPMSSKFTHVVLPSSFIKSINEADQKVTGDPILPVPHPDIDSEILTEADIKDDELKLYIKQPHELENLNMLTKRKSKT